MKSTTFIRKMIKKFKKINFNIIVDLSFLFHNNSFYLFLILVFEVWTNCDHQSFKSFLILLARILFVILGGGLACWLGWYYVLLLWIIQFMSLFSSWRVSTLNARFCFFFVKLLVFFCWRLFADQMLFNDLKIWFFILISWIIRNWVFFDVCHFNISTKI